MKLHPIDIAIVLAYFVVITIIGLRVSRRGAKDLDSYFLGGKALPWYLLGISDASGMFDISGTMWMVYILFVYGLKSIWLPFVWPVFNQIFLMVFMSRWVRQSNVLTGAEWIRTRFGQGAGANLAHLSVVGFALVNVVALLGYAFKGVGKFAAVILPWHFGGNPHGIFSDENVYAAILMGLTSLYVIKGGMISVVATEVMQFCILTFTSIAIGVIALVRVPPGLVARSVPAGWASPFFGWKLGIDWTGILDRANDAIRADGNEFFAVVFGFMFFKGILAAAAGPAPTYDMQRILATRSPREASLMNGLVSVVLLFPRYMLIAGITVLGIAFCMPQLRAMDKPDFEQILPLVLTQDLPAGVVGLLLAGLTAAFMSNFAATLNFAPAYLVNDIYKKYVNPRATGRTEVLLSRIASLAVLIAGTVVGLVATRITDVMMWIVGALYSGFVIANVLKWYWWRFNGYGYFWGMLAGILGAVFMPGIAARIAGHGVNPLLLFPAIAALSAAACVAGTLMTKPDEEAVLISFCRTIRPWGLWGPIRQKVKGEDPAFRPDRSLARGAFNIAAGIVWQLCLTALPIYIVLRGWGWVAALLALLAATSAILKFNWYDKLEEA